MKRFAFAAALLLAAGSFATGCRSCQSPYDYGSPVADCACTGCTACGNGRAGSVSSSGYAGGEYYAVPLEGGEPSSANLEMAEPAAE